MDNDDYRRGKPSCHKQFGEAIALLAGDALLTQAFTCIVDNELSSETKYQAVWLLSNAAGFHGMIGGQQLDLQYENTPATLFQLIEMNRKKTGALLHISCLLGCLVAGVISPDPKWYVVHAYADHLGVLFQLIDDILDVTGNQEALGKTVGKDEAAGKSTWVSLLGLEEAQKTAHELAQKARDAIVPYAKPGHFLHELPGWLITREN